MDNQTKPNKRSLKIDNLYEEASITLDLEAMKLVKGNPNAKQMLEEPDNISAMIDKAVSEVMPKDEHDLYKVLVNDPWVTHYKLYTTKEMTLKDWIYRTIAGTLNDMLFCRLHDNEEIYLKYA